MQVTVGAAAVETVTLRANPGSVGPGGGAVELIATVIGADGQLRPGPAVTITCAPASGSGSCAALQADTTSNTATVVFTITKPTGSSTLRTATLSFGDGNSQSLGNLAGGSATSTRIYSGPSGSSTASTYSATVQVVDINGETATASTVVIVTPRAVPPQLLVTLAATTGTAVVGVGQPVTLTATVTPATDGADVVSSYEWTFGDDTSAETDGNVTTHVYTTNGAKTATVEVTTTDGRTATAVVQFIVSGV